ncbi:DUF4386 domain-containing protein [Trebonia kvetii]|uniref:DUF4386 domain-containing protein n=1 Tax=Trebonia kvetii TaxID=2480626 RepID=A0A6P2C0E8_9ACTN|nr:DUF4386 domain-containing protein [Trebonia kvetii]TVZ02913.1 DUF4386 domain-containing protein [Trebonia kvetii]
MAIAGTGSARDVTGTGLKRTARTTGLLYPGLFITGISGFLVVRSQIFIAGDPHGTWSNLTGNESLARAGIALELRTVLTQALTAVWFYRLFRSVDTLAAGSLAAFGMASAVAIMGSAALLATALDVAGDGSLATTGGAAATVQLLYVASGHLWGVAAMFFGLWLIPMGRLVVRSRWLPQPLGWTLVAGGVAYLASAFARYLFPGASLVTQLLTIPATVGEAWIMGYLIIVGVREHAPSREAAQGACLRWTAEGRRYRPWNGDRSHPGDVLLLRSAKSFMS